MRDTFSLFLYFAPFLLILGAFVRRRRTAHNRNLSVLAESIATGMIEPPSLHPAIDPTLCVGCAACVNVCPEMPEHHVLGLIHGKANLLSPTDCIGHGACRLACPVDAITLVFGTERRGVDIPHVGPDFQTNVPGIYIAGELGGMGLIHNAVEQGRQAVESIVRAGRPDRGPDRLDLLIVGAGPAGFAASLAALENRLNFVTVEQETLGGTIAHFPRGKLVMTAPARLPLAGEFRFRETTKEKLIEFLSGVERKTGIRINYRERVESVQRLPDEFVVKTTSAVYRARHVLLAIGRRGTPRKLGVPGEERSKVTYRLIDPEQYAGRRVLVVGGGDSALEAAWSIAEIPGTRVTLSYRSAAFTRAKQKNRERIATVARDGRLDVIMCSTLKSIEDDSVCLLTEANEQRLPNDAVIINAGGILPTAFLRDIGIAVDTKFGTT